MSIRVKLSKTKSSLEALHSVAILTMHSINNNNNCPQSGLLGTLRLMCIVRNDIRLPRTFCWVANKMCNHECCLTVLTSNHFLQSPIMHSIHIEVIQEHSSNITSVRIYQLHQFNEHKSCQTSGLQTRFKRTCPLQNMLCSKNEIKNI